MVDVMDACDLDMSLTDRYKVLVTLTVDTMPGLTANEAKVAHRLLLDAAHTASAVADAVHIMRQSDMATDLLDYIGTILRIIENIVGKHE